MFSKLSQKVLLHKAGLSSVTLPSFPTGNNKSTPNDGSSPTDANNSNWSNPFANVTVSMPKALQSWQTPPPPPIMVCDPPILGTRAPTNPKLKFPAVDGRAVVVFFMRFCGCPFTEKLFLAMRSLSTRHPGVHFIAISHCTPAATNLWVSSLGGAWNVDVIVDQSRELYALWGLGISNYGHLLNPSIGYNQYLLGKKEGVWGKQVGEGGCRWQIGGAWAVDSRGILRWGGGMKRADEEVVLLEGVKAVGG